MKNTLFFLASFGVASLSFGQSFKNSYTISVDINGHPHCLANAKEGLKMELCSDPQWAVSGPAELWTLTPYYNSTGTISFIYLQSQKDALALHSDGSMGRLVEDDFTTTASQLVSMTLLSDGQRIGTNLLGKDSKNQVLFSTYPDAKDVLCLSVDLDNHYGHYAVNMIETSFMKMFQDCTALDFNLYKGKNSKPVDAF